MKIIEKIPGYYTERSMDTCFEEIKSRSKVHKYLDLSVAMGGGGGF